MATTTIPWGDGSGDNIYLNYSASQGDQTVLVSSDANTGSNDRTINITLTASHHGTSSAKILTITQEGVPETYIVFVDPVVEQICATTWGDGTGIKPSQAALVTNNGLGTTFKSNTDITSFDEFEYFTGVTSLAAGAFNGCSNLISITLPNTITSIGAGGMGSGSFGNCTSLTNLTIPSSVTSFPLRAVHNCGDTTGVLIVNGNMERDAYGSATSPRFRKIVINGNYIGKYNNININSSKFIEVMKISGNISNVSNSTMFYGGSNTASALKFFEVMGTCNAALFFDNNNTLYSGGTILHLGYDTVSNNAFPCTVSQSRISYARITKVYVGKGQSASEDNAILAMYMADSGWSSYSSKLDTWYNYVNSPGANPDYIS